MRRSGEIVVGAVVLIGIAAFSLLQWALQVNEMKRDCSAPPGVNVMVKR